MRFPWFARTKGCSETFNWAIIIYSILSTYHKMYRFNFKNAYSIQVNYAIVSRTMSLGLLTVMQFSWYHAIYMQYAIMYWGFSD
jgi:hypothetical protein